MLKKTFSSDSWDSIFTSRNRKIRPTIVPQSQSGRNVTCTSFLMCFVAVLLLTCGLILLGVSVWSLLRKLPYTYLIDVKVDIPYFAIPASCICMPCFWISMSIHNNEKKYQFLHLLISLLLISIALLITGTSLGFMFLSRVNPEMRTGTVITTLNIHDLNNTLRQTMLESSSNDKFMYGWNIMQQQLKCCGVATYHDWLNTQGTTPRSCCRIRPCTVSNVYLKGCLEVLSRDLIWHLNILKSQCYMVIIIQTSAVVLAATIYFSQKRT